MNRTDGQSGYLVTLMIACQHDDGSYEVDDETWAAATAKWDALEEKMKPLAVGDGFYCTRDESDFQIGYCYRVLARCEADVRDFSSVYSLTPCERQPAAICFANKTARTVSCYPTSEACTHGLAGLWAKDRSTEATDCEATR